MVSGVVHGLRYSETVADLVNGATCQHRKSTPRYTSAEDRVWLDLAWVPVQLLLSATHAFSFGYADHFCVTGLCPVRDTYCFSAESTCSHV